MRKCGARAWQNAASIHVMTCGQHWLLRRGKKLEDLWEELNPEEDPDDLIPYWTELWPSSILLASFLFDHADEFAKNICIDLGCGLGFTALVGQSLGGTVLGTDYLPDALKLAKSHAGTNLAPQPFWLCADWRRPAFKPRIAWRIWGADIVYEKRFTEPLLTFMDYCLAPGGKVWIAEPGRAIFQQFLQKATQTGWNVREASTARVSALYPRTPAIQASIWEFSRLAEL